MGIKFRGKTTTGNPAASAIKERELEINLADGTLFTSSDGTDIIPLGDGPEVGGIAFDVLIAYVVGDIVTDDLDGLVYTCVTAGSGNQPSTPSVEWQLVANTAIAVTSKTAGTETRIPEIVEMTQANYDALGAGRPQKLYIIVG